METPRSDEVIGLRHRWKNLALSSGGASGDFNVMIEACRFVKYIPYAFIQY